MTRLILKKKPQSAGLLLLLLLLAALPLHRGVGRGEAAADDQDQPAFALSRIFQLDTLEAQPSYQLDSVAFSGQNVGGGDGKSAGPSYYTVLAGDTLSGIADAYGLSAPTLAAANGLPNADAIFPGQRLLLSVSSRSSSLRGKVTAGQLPTPAPLAAVTGNGTLPVSDGAGFRTPITYTYISQGFSSLHKAVDFAAPIGTPIVASSQGCYASGLQGWNGGYGTVLTMTHANGYTTLYAHLSGIELAPGQCVQAGQIIAYSGNSGRSTGPHLHFEIRLNGTQLNPLHYVH